MLETILGVLASPGLGAITGLFGGWMTKRENRKNKEMEFAHEEKMANIDKERDAADHAHDIALLDKKSELSLTEGQIEADLIETKGDIEVDKSAADAFALSQVSKIPAMEYVKAAVRPTITAILLYYAWDIYATLTELTGGLDKIDKAILVDLYVYVIHAIIYLAVTAVMWWFASRGDKAIDKIKGMFHA